MRSDRPKSKAMEYTFSLLTNGEVHQKRLTVLVSQWVLV
jgi:hypothetical protein